MELYQRLVEAERNRLAELELEYGIEKSKGDAIRSKLFGALRTYDQQRDRLRVLVNFRGGSIRAPRVVFSALAENRRLRCEMGSLVMRANHAARARHGTGEGACAPLGNGNSARRRRRA